MKTLLVDTPAKRLLFNTIRVDTILDDGSSGTGTAFIVSHTHARGTSAFVVTNRHIVDGVRSGSLVFTLAREGQPVLGSRFELHIDDFPQAWHLHPDPSVDLAIVPFAPLVEAAQQQGVQLYWQAIDTRTVPTDEQQWAMDALEEVLFVGYPSGVWDQVNGMPILRRGTTATPPALDFEGRREFLIDAAVYPGSSGSPVFVRADGGGAISPEKLRFAGVVAAVFFREEANRLVSAPVPASTATTMGSEMIDLGLVIKSRVVVELIEDFLRRWIA